MDVRDEWLLPEVGRRVRQLVPSGPFVVQRRIDLGLGGCRMTRHRGAITTTFTIMRYAERSEIGLPCHVVHVQDDRDGQHYVVDTGLCGPGLPSDAFLLLEPPGPDGV